MSTEAKALNDLEYSYESSCPIARDGESIRLVSITSGPPGERIRISLERRSLREEQLSYVALSYVWGDASNPIPILCDGSSVTITRNLHSALLRLRDALTDNERPLGRIVPFNKLGSDVCPIWIDALCINQKDIEERAAQVRLMGKIYRQARRVIIWLGEENVVGEADECFIATEIIANRRLEILAGRRPNESGMPYGPGGPYVLLGDIEDDNSTRFRQLLRNQWFSRTWVFQEVALAQEAVLLWGSMSLDWNFIPTAMHSFLPGEENTARIRHDSVSIAAILNIIGVGGFHIARDRGSSTLTALINVLQAVRMNGCSDPRDKVFALLGIANQIGTLEANYRKSLAEVYVETAWTLIEETNSLELLTLTHASYRRGDIPSWVPDWREPFNLHTMAWGEDRENKRYRPTGDRKMKIFSNPDRTKLTLEAAECDQVAKIITHELPKLKQHLFEDYLKRHANTPGDDMFHTFGAGAESLGLAGHYEPTNEPMTVAYIRTIVADLLPQTDKLSEKQKKEHFPAYMQKYKLSEPTLPNIGEVGLCFQAIKEIYARAGRLFEGRCLALTVDGYLALVPEGTTENDLIFMVAGSAAPLVLRPRSGGYEYLGESYVHGVMDGEVVKWLDRRGWGSITLV